MEAWKKMLLNIVIIITLCNLQDATKHVTLPSSYFEDGTLMQQIENQKELFIDIHKYPSGGVTILMRQTLYDQLIGNLQNEIQLYCNRILKENGNIIKKVIYNEEYNQMSIEVDSSRFGDETMKVKTLELIGLAITYQCWTRDNIQIEVTIVDAETKEVLQNIIYPQI